MATRKNTGSKSDQIRSLLASGLAPADIAQRVGCSRNLVYVVKAQQGGGKKKGKKKKKKTRRKTASKAGSPGRSNASDDLVEQFLGRMKELERERDQLRGVVEKIQQLVNKHA